jgi:exosortase A-associated hydrolase 1
MNWVDEAIAFACGDDTLIAVLSRPTAPAETGVVVIVGGPQYRAGSHRQFVLLARAMAGVGFPVLRFDVRGMGDSSGSPRGFEATGRDVEAAIDALQRRVAAVRQVVLVGLCDGASAALLYCHERNDRRVRGLCLLNPWVRSETSLAVTHVKHYYTRRLLQREFWTKLARGEVGLSAAVAAWRSVRLAASGARALNKTASPKGELPFQQRMADAWISFEGSILLVLSGDDYTAKEFIEHVRQSAPWKGALERGKLDRHELAGADHTFSNGGPRAAMENLIVKWLRRLSCETFPPAALPASSLER